MGKSLRSGGNCIMMGRSRCAPTAIRWPLSWLWTCATSVVLTAICWLRSFLATMGFLNRKRWLASTRHWTRKSRKCLSAWRMCWLRWDRRNWNRGLRTGMQMKTARRWWMPWTKLTPRMICSITMLYPRCHKACVIPSVLLDRLWQCQWLQPSVLPSECLLLAWRFPFTAKWTRWTLSPTSPVILHQAREASTPWLMHGLRKWNRWTKCISSRRMNGEPRSVRLRTRRSNRKSRNCL